MDKAKHINIIVFTCYLIDCILSYGLYYIIEQPENKN